MNIIYGNAVVGQSGGPTAAINATLSGVLRGAAEAIRQGKMGKIYGMRHGIEGLLEGHLTDLSALAADRKRLRLLEQTPSSSLGSCRKKLPDPAKDDAPYRRLLEIFRQHDIRTFFYIGGNDSMDTVARLSAWLQGQNYPMQVVGVPKTIDNDLVGTDHTPGYGSAAKYIAATVQDMLRDTAVYTVRAVTVVEIMGRDAGWLTAAAALPGYLGDRGPDLVYLPERTFDMERFFTDVEKAWQSRPGLVVAVSEGIRFADGRYVGEGTQSGVVDAFGHKYLSGTGKVLEMALREHFGCKARAVELNLPQRCASYLTSAADLSESVRVGKAAVRAALQGKTGCMMTFARLPGEGYSLRILPRPVAEIANCIRTVPDAYINEAGNGITEEGMRYLAPLIMGERKLLFRGGLPCHLVIPDTVAF